VSIGNKTNRGRRDRANGKWVVSRRVFLRASALSVIGAGLSQLSCAALPCGSSGKGRGTSRFGIVTDCHYADTDSRGSRHYRESLEKLGECIELMNSEKVDFLIELGDFKDEKPPGNEQQTMGYLKAIEEVYQGFDGPTYHVLGNHDMDSISKEQFLSNVENTGIDSTRKYYSFDSGGLHFTVLDANYKPNFSDYDHGNFSWIGAHIPPGELEWLERDLQKCSGPAICFVHQLLDGTGSHYVKNASDVRAILEASGKVPAVFQGHRHSGSYSHIEGIHYYTLKGMIEGSGPENSSYAIVEVLGGGDIIVTGYRRAVSRQMEASVVSPVSS